MEQESEAAAPAGTNSSAPNAPAQDVSAPAASTIPQCEKPGGMGLARIVEIDTTKLAEVPSVAHIVVDPSHPTTLYVGGEGLWVIHQD